MTVFVRPEGTAVDRMLPPPPTSLSLSLSHTHTHTRTHVYFVGIVCLSSSMLSYLFSSSKLFLSHHHQYILCRQWLSILCESFSSLTTQQLYLLVVRASVFVEPQAVFPGSGCCLSGCSNILASRCKMGPSVRAASWQYSNLYWLLALPVTLPGDFLQVPVWINDQKVSSFSTSGSFNSRNIHFHFWFFKQS